MGTSHHCRVKKSFPPLSSLKNFIKNRKDKEPNYNDRFVPKPYPVDLGNLTYQRGIPRYFKGNNEPYVQQKVFAKSL
jgi:hypothetical protein